MPDVNTSIADPAAVKANPCRMPRRMPLEQTRIKLEQFARQSWVVTLSDATPREAIFEPDFWLHIANKMHPLDKVCVTDDAGTYYLECIVTGVDRTQAFIQQVTEVSLVKPPQPEDADLTVAWAGPHRRWEVLRGDKVLGTGHATRDAAERAMAGFAGGRA
jgi:hypothetical protein